jgi:ligand-binding sensor domain-containing protein/DNA-binding CsgD family transcriptional regulator
VRTGEEFIIGIKYSKKKHIYHKSNSQIMKISRIYFSFLLLFSISQTIGQVKSIGLPDITNYKRTTYKGGTQNWNIDQDQDGNVYFANNSGLLEFDGTNWTKHPLPNNNTIRSLKIDNSGKIFVGANNEFGYFKDNDKGKLIYFSLSKLIKKKESKDINLIWRIHLYQGAVVFQSFAKVYFYKNNKLSSINAPTRFQFSFLLNERLYFQDKSLGLFEYRNGKLIPLIGTSELNGTEIWSMFKIDNNKMLLATLEKGLFVYENDKITAWNTEANTFIKKNTSLGGVMINNKFIALNSVLDGVIICDLNGRIIQHINRQKGLQNNTILTSFVDNKNNLWLGLDNGIAFINENSPFTFFDFSYNISTVYATTVYQGNLYVATNQGLFYHPWNNTNFKDEPFTLVQGTNAQAWNIQVIDNNLLCASNRGTLLINGGTATKNLHSTGYFGFKSIPNHPLYIIGLSYTGFSVFKEGKNGLEFLNHIIGFDETVNSFEIELDENYLWLKKAPYLYQMKLSDDLTHFESVKKYSKLSDSFVGVGSIQYINNKVYFQTKNHFYRYSKEQETFFEDKEKSKLFKNVPQINSLTEDSNGNLWYVFNESLGVFKKNSTGNYVNEVTPFSNLTGNIVSNNLSINTIDSKNIFIGLTDGLAHYDSKILKNYIAKPKAFIKTFSYPGQVITLRTANKSKNYTIPYVANHVKFTFTSPTYENQESVKYSYKLEPFDDSWRNWTTLSLKEYTNLKEGSYKMRLKSKNSYGIESEVATVEFSISPPWYRHFLAYIFYVIAFIATVYFIRLRIIMKIRKNKYYETIEQRKLYLEKESKIREEQLELEKEIERLKYEQLQLKILSKDKELVNNTLQVVKKNKVLNGIINKIKDINVDKLDESTKFQFTKLNKSIVKEVNADKSWKDLEKHINNVHFDFLKRLKEKCPTISPRELDLSTYLLMNMTTKEIAEIMNISIGGVELARYRLRKKLNLTKTENLIGFLMSI